MEELVAFTKEFATVLFFCFFTYTLFQTYHKKNKHSLEAIKYSIFTDDELRRMK